MISGLDVHYDLGGGHPLIGRRMPDLDLHTADGPSRVFSRCTTPGRCCSISVSPAASTALLGGSGSADRRPARRHVGLPVLGEVSAPIAVLIRPDGYVAWVGELTDPGLADALTTWFGAAT